MRNIKLMVFDIDNTITTGTSIWELLHQDFGTWKQYGQKYLEQFLKKEIDFDEFARLDVACWQGKSLTELKECMTKVQINSGFAELMDYLNQKQIISAVISSSLGQFADYLAAKYKIQKIFANPLGVKNNCLDGTIDLQVPGHGKKEILKKLVKELNIEHAEVAVVGDSHFDLPMFEYGQHTFIIKNEKLKDQARYFIKDFWDIYNLIKN